MARSKEVEETLKQFGLKPKEERQLLADVPFSGVAVIKGISRTRAPRQPLYPNTRVKFAQGRTAIRKGSLRDKVIAACRSRRKEGWTIEQLTKLLKFDVKPVVIKLRDAGWVEVL